MLILGYATSASCSCYSFYFIFKKSFLHQYNFILYFCSYSYIHEHCVNGATECVHEPQLNSTSLPCKSKVEGKACGYKTLWAGLNSKYQ